MAKYDLAFKLAAVKAYLIGEGGYQFISEKFGVADKKSVREWVKTYEVFGESGLERRKSSKAYPVQFKLDVLQYKLRTVRSPTYTVQFTLPEDKFKIIPL